MNTTPKPRATKKSNGELVGPPPLLSDPVGEGEAEGEAEGVVIEGLASVEEAIFLSKPPYRRLIMLLQQGR